eukprot:comp6654_c0_seq1/m.2423 comp6654_c0_seq1/g.2423  ORF comp6654_c0_seq1/g.2423 comp6654_c0_seq1/m.2423 type:complete len:540 (-) comp6654_c0_seq1:75-1694(-)
MSAVENANQNGANGATPTEEREQGCAVIMKLEGAGESSIGSSAQVDLSEKKEDGVGGVINKQGLHILTLPDHILEVTFLHLNQNDLWNVSHVCLRFRAISAYVCRTWNAGWPRRPLHEVVKLYPKIIRFRMERGRGAGPAKIGLCALSRLELLMHLDLSWCKEVTDENSRVIFPALKQLRSLDVSFCTGLGDDALDALRGLTRLMEINVSGCYRITDAGARALGTVWSLTVVQVSRCNKLTDNALLSLSELPNLVHLNAASLSQVGDGGLFALAAAEKLSLLDLSGCDLITSRGLRVLSSSLPRLHTLNVDYCYRVGDPGVESLGHLSQLTRLNIAHIDMLTDMGFAELSSLNGLVSLNVCWCRELTDIGLVSTLSHMPRLQVLDVSGCENMTDATAELLGQMGSLRILNVSWCKKITDEGAAAIAGATTLEELDIGFCDRLSDEGVKSLAQLGRLRRLDISQCPQVTDEGVRALSNLTALTKLVALSCEFVTSSGYAFLPHVVSHPQPRWHAQTSATAVTGTTGNSHASPPVTVGETV